MNLTKPIDPMIVVFSIVGFVLLIGIGIFFVKLKSKTLRSKL